MFSRIAADDNRSGTRVGPITTAELGAKELGRRMADAPGRAPGNGSGTVPTMSQGRNNEEMALAAIVRSGRVGKRRLLVVDSAAAAAPTGAVGTAAVFSSSLNWQPWHLG